MTVADVLTAILQYGAADPVCDQSTSTALFSGNSSVADAVDVAVRPAAFVLETNPVESNVK